MMTRSYHRKYPASGPRNRILSCVAVSDEEGQKIDLKLAKRFPECKTEAAAIRCALLAFAEEK